MFAPDELIAALSDGAVECVLIGGLAVAAHGFPRATKDVEHEDRVVVVAIQDARSSIAVIASRD